MHAPCVWAIAHNGSMNQCFGVFTLHNCVSSRLVAGIALALSLSAPVIAQKAVAGPLAVYISVDMEGVAGVVTADHLGPQGFEYERFRHFMTDETLAAVRAAKAAGATKILVADSHGNAESLLIDEFPR